jgi:hypothetical protein
VIAETNLAAALPLSFPILKKDENNLSVALSLPSCNGSIENPDDNLEEI